MNFSIPFCHCVTSDLRVDVDNTSKQGSPRTVLHLSIRTLPVPTYIILNSRDNYRKKSLTPFLTPTTWTSSPTVTPPTSVFYRKHVSFCKVLILGRRVLSTYVLNFWTPLTLLRVEEDGVISTNRELFVITSYFLRSVLSNVWQTDVNPYFNFLSVLPWHNKSLRINPPFWYLIPFSHKSFYSRSPTTTPFKSPRLILYFVLSVTRWRSETRPGLTHKYP